MRRPQLFSVEEDRPQLLPRSEGGIPLANVSQVSRPLFRVSTDEGGDILR